MAGQAQALVGPQASSLTPMRRELYGAAFCRSSVRSPPLPFIPLPPPWGWGSGQAWRTAGQGLGRGRIQEGRPQEIFPSPVRMYLFLPFLSLEIEVFTIFLVGLSDSGMTAVCVLGFEFSLLVCLSPLGLTSLPQTSDSTLGTAGSPLPPPPPRGTCASPPPTPAPHRRLL